MFPPYSLIQSIQTSSVAHRPDLYTGTVLSFAGGKAAENEAVQ